MFYEPQTEYTPDVMDTYGLALLIEKLNRLCSCERGKPDYHCKKASIHRWWMEE